MIDLLLHRYGGAAGLQYVLQLPAAEGMALIRQVRKVRAEERAWQLYVQIYPWMSRENYLSFAEFYPPAAPSGAAQKKDGLANARRTLDLLIKSREEA